MKKLLLVYLMAVAAVLTGCSKTGTVVLTGEIKGECDELLVLSYPQGGMTEYMSPELEDGRFRVEKEAVKDFMDFGIALGDEVYGAHVRACDSLHVIFTAQGDGTFDVEYQGDCEEESRMFKDFYDTYCYWGQYNVRPEKDPDMTMEDSFKLIDDNDAAFRAKYGRSLGKYYRHRADMTCTFLKAVLLEENDYMAGRNVVRNPQFRDMMDKVDPDDPLTISCGLVNRWLRFKLGGLYCSEVQKPLRFIDSRDGRIKSLDVRKIIVDYFCYSALYEFERQDDAYYNDFFDRMAEYIKEDSLMIQDYRAENEKIKAALNVKNLPELTLTSPDGSSIQLSSLYGKALYIDIWASWCGPCCREIPQLAEMVGKFESEGIDARVISISVDSDADAWKDALARHKPSWPQYILSEEDHYYLSDALAMETIPRFVIVAPDGTIYDKDAPRPSDGELTVESVKSAAASL